MHLPTSAGIPISLLPSSWLIGGVKQVENLKLNLTHANQQDLHFCTAQDNRGIRVQTSE